MTFAEDTRMASDLLPDSRSARLREMQWQGAHVQARARRPVVGSGKNTLVGHAKDFAALLDASDPFIQPGELIVGCCLASPADKNSINLGFYNPHYPPGHETILRYGLAGMAENARTRLPMETDPARRDFLRAVEISFDAARRYVQKYAQHAQAMAASETDPQRKADLDRVRCVCNELAVAPPSSFHAALQLVQFTRIFGGMGCIGRFDQWMHPFYARDVAEGRITRREARELLECFFIKLNHFAETAKANNDTLRNITLAGQTASGEDACNELTCLCLEASARLMLPEPKLNVRFFHGSPHRLLRECCRVLAKGANVLALYNDEVAVPALSSLGIPIEDAREYCNDGCSELLIGGKSTIRFFVHDSLPLLTETVLNAEHRPYETFGDVMADFKSRLTRYMPEDHGAENPITFPYFAAGIEDCLERASPSGARYNLWGSILAEVGNSADGLAAIKKLVYEEKAIAWDELVRAIQADFEGHERLRQMLLNRPQKYGNDNDEVDGIVKEIAEYFCDGVHARARNPVGPGWKRAAGLMCFGIHLKKDLSASPDGRRKGDFTASSFSPSIGMDRSGPTAVLKSVAKVDLRKASHGSVLDMALHASVVRSREGFEKFVALLDSFLKMPCAATLQLNVIDRDALLNARSSPGSPEFRTLIVRVWGFSAVFVELPTDLQDHVIARTEHTLDG